MGGGGAAGKVGFPSYMENFHTGMLTSSASTSLNTVLETAVSTNPMTGLSFTDPVSDITALNTRFNSMADEVAAINHTTDWNNLVTQAVTSVDTAGVLQDIDVNALAVAARSGAEGTITEAVRSAFEAIDETVLANAVQQYVNVRRLERARLRTRYKASMSGISAERSSAYALGMALLETEFERETGQFQTELSTQMFQQGFQAYVEAFRAELVARIQTASLEKQTRDQILLQGVAQMLQYREFLVDLKKNLVQVMAETKRLGYVMDSEFVGNTADLNRNFAMWQLDAFNAAITVVGGLGGGTYIPKAPSKAGSVLGGVFSGAAAGAALGPGGAMVGGLIGGIAGAIN